MAGFASRTFPLSAGGSAADAVLPSGQLVLTDLTARPRFGIKGPGSAKWLERQGMVLPPVNRIAAQGGFRLLRLGTEDFLVIDEAGGSPTAELTAKWNADDEARGYWSWREEGWSWMRVTGPMAASVMARLCALDLRAGRFGDGEVAQTRVAHLEAVLILGGGGFDVFFDIASTAFFIRAVAFAADFAADGSTTQGQH